MTYWIQNEDGSETAFTGGDVKRCIESGIYQSRTFCARTTLKEDFTPFFRKTFQHLAAFPEFANFFSAEDADHPISTTATRRFYASSDNHKHKSPIQTPISPSKPVLTWTLGVLIAFFLPWFQFLGQGISGYQIGNLGSYGNYVWAIPILSAGTIMLTFAGQDNRAMGALTGLVPIGSIIYAIGHIGMQFGGRAAEQTLQLVQQVFSIGAYLTLLCSLGLLASAAQPATSPQPTTAKEPRVPTDKISQLERLAQTRASHITRKQSPMKYHLRKSPEHPESRFLVTHEEIEDQLKTGQIDPTWQARAEGESQWQGVSVPAAPSPPPSSAGKSMFIAFLFIVSIGSVGSLLVSGDLISLLSSTTFFQSREDVAREALASRVRSESGGLIRLVAFEKTNGMEHPVMGNALYRIEYTATIEAVEDCLWTLGGQMWDGTFAATPGKPRSGIEAFNPQVFGKNPATKGQHHRVTGDLVLQKSEKGWRAAQ